MSSYETIRIEEHDGYAELILDRPDRLNAIDEQMAEELCDALGRIATREEVRAVLLRGEGRAFSAGGDVKAMCQELEDAPGEFFEEPLRKIHQAARALAELPRPVVGALHGFASGAGFNLALSCDLLVCSRETRFNQAFIRIGVVPDTGGTFFLPRLVGNARAREMFMLGEFIDADTAQAIGIVNRVVAPDDLLDEARSLAARLAVGPTRAYGEIKRLMLDGSSRSLAEALDAERDAQCRIGQTQDFREGIRAFVEKRTPKYTGR